MKSFKTEIYFHREKEENWNICSEAEVMGFKNSDDLVYLGYEVGFEVEVSEELSHKVLKINDIDVSDKEIYI